MDISYYKEKYEPIDGKWYIKEMLGEGSYGKVFRVERKDMSGTYSAALKIITIPQSEKKVDNVRTSLQDENSVSQYFENMTKKLVEEFKLMSQLKGNSNIVSYEEHDIFPHENGIGYDILIRMELLKPLNKHLEELSEQDIIRIGIDICKALEVCQKYNIVHRDIKPENIFVSPAGDYKLGDFGVAKTMKNEMTVMTTAGTYVYMAPELKKGEECGSNVDIYSLGMVMYKLLNFNREPFLPLPPKMFTFEQKEQALINRLKGMKLQKPANASEQLSKIILKACEYNPKERYESPALMRIELEKLLSERRIHTKIEKEAADEGLNGKNNEADETISLFDGEHTTTKEGVGPPTTKASEKEMKIPVNKYNKAIGGIEKPVRMPRKKKLIALILAVFPYTGILGGYHFYIGDGKGILRLCTLNFLYVGWLADIVMAIINLLHKDK